MCTYASLDSMILFMCMSIHTYVPRVEHTAIDGCFECMNDAPKRLVYISAGACTSMVRDAI